MSDYYVLDGKMPVRVADVREWGRRFEKDNRVVAKTKVPGADVSTVFLGLDHAFDNGPPQLFETMIFGGPDDGYCERCSTWEEAEKQHAIAVTLATAGAEP